LEPAALKTGTIPQPLTALPEQLITLKRVQFLHEGEQRPWKFFRQKARFQTR
jgi:hypothetical protein